MYDENLYIPFRLAEYLGWRSESQWGAEMNFWEQLGLTIFASILNQLHFDPAKVTTMSKVLIPMRDTLNLLYPPNITLVSPLPQAK
jgi:hypothetical protein